ncbi:MAG TPA: M48 family metallopeptidase [Gemmatimonadaceae bacterium]|nr:M48 family metallopeptidase [Gemmatimonadaceae bacterium]
MSEDRNLFAQQEANRIRSRWLVILFVLFFAWLGFGGDWIFHEATRDAAAGYYRHTLPWLGVALTALAIGLAWHAWRTGPERVLWATGAREITDPRTPEERQLVNVVEEMAIAASLPRPRVYIVPDADPNAFATGRDDHSAHIAVTQGLLALCSRDELQAVVAHETAHIRNLDVRLMTLLAGLVGAVALVGEGMGRVIRGTRGIRLPVPRKGRGGNPLLAIALVLWLVSWMLAPLITRLLALAVSRKREYLADAAGAQFTRNPMALAAALEKIERAHAPTAAIKGGSAHLCIADPLGRRVTAREGWLADVLATHPPMTMRIARLRGMAFQDAKRAGTYEAMRAAPQRTIA